MTETQRILWVCGGECQGVIAWLISSGGFEVATCGSVEEVIARTYGEEFAVAVLHLCAHHPVGLQVAHRLPPDVKKMALVCCVQPDSRLGWVAQAEVNCGRDKLISLINQALEG